MCFPHLLLTAPIHWLRRHFADGFPNLFVKDATRIRNRHVGFLASFHNPGTIFEQISVIYQLPRMFIGSFTLVLPYFPTGTAERVRHLQPSGCSNWITLKVSSFYAWSTADSAALFLSVVVIVFIRMMHIKPDS